MHRVVSIPRLRFSLNNKLMSRVRLVMDTRARMKSTLIYRTKRFRAKARYKKSERKIYWRFRGASHSSPLTSEWFFASSRINGAHVPERFYFWRDLSCTFCYCTLCFELFFLPSTCVFFAREMTAKNVKLFG